MQVIVWRVGRPAPLARLLSAAACTLLVMACTALLAWPEVWPALSVVIDAGHGGKDPGAVGLHGLLEKDVTLAVARHAALLLQDAGEQAVLTRTNDNRLQQSQRSDLLARVQVANEAQADAVISIHCNTFRLRSVRGPRTYYQPGSQKGYELAKYIQQSLRTAVGYGPEEPFAEDHLITRATPMVAVIVELGYISNPSEEKLLADPTMQRRLAQAVVNGVLNWARAAY